MRKFILLLLLSCLYLSVFGQTVGSIDLSGLPKPTQAESLRYWFDNDIGSLQATKQHNGLRTIDVASLFEGLHTLHYQIIDNEGTAAVPYSSIFMKLSESVNAKAKYVRYWFDNDTEALKADAINGVMMLDASELLEGLHTIHYQVVDDSGTATTPYSSLFMKLSASVNSKAKEVRYWFDNDTYVQKADAVNGVMMLDASQLLEGLHTIHYQVVDDSGTATTPYSAIFMKLSLAGKEVTASRIIYWFDDDAENIQNAEMSNGVQILDASSLIDGLHTIHYQVICSDGTLTSVYSSLFLRINVETGTTVAKSLRYWFDDQTNVSETEISNETQILDVSDLIQGLHTLHCQIVDTNGTLGIPMSSIFMKLDINTELSHAKRQRYWFDDDKSTVVEEDIVGGIQSLDVSGLLTGLHTLHYQLLDEQGNVSVPYSAIFMKMFEQNIPEGGNVITRYMYWVNDDSKNNQKVDIENPSNPYNLISLLPMVKVPIRSSDFKFELTNGKPMMYAKNDFHIRFYDAAGYWVDDAKSFVDYSISQEVTDIVELQSTQTFARPAENAVKWFKIDVEKGDTVAFKSSQATSIQLLSSVGEEVYSADGSKSVEFGGCRILENGTYYVAIHDVTGSKSDITFDYMRMGKFALLTDSRPELGSLPIVQIINIEGNGFDNLKIASIVKGDNVLMADSIAHISNQTARLYWILSGEETLGSYDLSLHFDDEEDQRDIIKKDFVTLTKPSFDGITVEVSDPRRVADPYPVYIKVTNNSNIAYQAIPFYFAIDHIDRMYSVKYMDFAVGCCKELYDAGLKLSFEYDNFNGNNSKTRVVPTIIPELLPGETKTFTLGVKTNAHQIFNVYAWNGIPWNLIAPETKEYIKNHYSELTSKPNVKKAPGIAGIFDGCEDDPCDLAGVGGDLSECACGTALALGGTIGGIQNALQNQHNRAMRDQLAQSGLFDDPNEFFPDQHLPSPADLMWYWTQHCLPGKAGQAASAYDTGRELMGDNPCQDPPPHECNAYNPGDPNEIHGYVSEAGSKYIRREVTDVSYTIEFENDPNLANASAHKIVVCDTLDTNVFDASSFMPKSIKIGNKQVEFDENQNSVKTIDMRPEINAIAEVEVKFDQKTGIAMWIISSLDPMTMEETYDIMQGVLPVNNDGNGIGFISYNVSLKHELEDGESFSNRASITFDFEDAILTPIWTNTIDAIAPESTVASIDIKNDSTATVKVQATDNLSGVWKYDVYVRYGSEGSSWYKAVEGATTEDIDVKYYKDVVHAFCVVATDSAGNVEKKELIAEFELSNGVLGDSNLDGFVNVNDITTIAKFILEGKVSPWSKVNADANEDGTINVNDITKTAEIILLRAKAEMEAKAAMEAAFKAAHSED